MANVKITDLSALTNPASTDVLAIVDVAADVTKKVTIADLLENAGDGTAAAPAFSFDSDPNSGLYNESADKLGFSTNGVGRVYIDGSGNVGIAQVNPSAPLEFGKAVYGTNSSEDFYRIKFNNLVNTVNDVGIGQPDANSIALNSSNNGSIIFYQGSDGEVARFHTNGYLGIGNSTPTRTLDVTGTAAVSGALTAGSAAVTGTLTQGGNNVVTVGDTGTVTSTMIADGTIVDADVNASAAIGLSKLATGALPTGITVASANIVDGTIVDADVNASAAIGLSKLATGALPTGITVASANIVDGTIVDADVSATAEIAVSKLANGTARQLLQTDAAGTGVEFTSNVDVPGTLDVSSTAVFDGNVGIGASSPTELLQLEATDNPKIRFVDTGNYEYKLGITSNNKFSLLRSGSDTETITVDSSGRAGIGTNNPGQKLVISEGGAQGLEFNPFTSDRFILAGYNRSTSQYIQLEYEGSNHIFKSGTSEKMRINSSGNVGIGTTSPIVALDAFATPNTTFTNSPFIQRLYTTDDSAQNIGGGISFGGKWNGSANQYADFALISGVKENATAGNYAGALTFATRPAGSGPGNYERMRITSGGNVGIGNTDPEAILTLGDFGGATELIRFRCGTAQVAGIDFGDDDDDDVGRIRYQHVEDSMVFTANAGERMRISSAGNVGIGASTDLNQRLCVQGTSNDTVDETKGTAKFEGSGGNGLLFGTRTSSPFGSYVQSAYVQDTSVARYPLLLNPIGGNVGINNLGPTAPLDLLTTNARLLVREDQSDLCLDSVNTANSAFDIFRIRGYDILFQYGGTERMRLAGPSGNFGIGTSSPSTRLHVSGDTYTSGNTFFKSNNGSGISGGTVTGKFIQGSDGNLISCRAVTTGATHQTFVNSNGIIGSITTVSSTTSFNTSSDYRLKENIVDLDGAINRVKQLAPRRFNFIADADTTVDGFLAHEAQAVVPEAVTGSKDEVDDDGNAVMQGIDQSKLVPLLTAALKEAIAKIETLEQRLTDAGL